MPTTEDQPALTDFQKYEAMVASGEQPQIATDEAATEVKTPSGEAEKASESPAPESETGEDTAEKEEKKASKRGFDKRISELTREKREAREEAERLRKELESLKAGKSDTASPAASDKTGLRPRPKMMDFQTVAEWDDAIDAWERERDNHLIEQAERRIAEKKAKAEAEKAQREAAETWESRIELARADHEDYDAIALDKSLPVTEIMFAMIRDSENGAELLYHLGKNHGDAERISKLNPAGQARAIARLEAKLFPDPAETAKPAAAVKVLPKPPKTVKGETADVDAMPDPKNFAEYDRWASRQERQRRRDLGYDD